MFGHLGKLHGACSSLTCSRLCTIWVDASILS